MILVIKLSGKVLEEDLYRTSLCRQIVKLFKSQHQIVVVHGGGKQLTDLCTRLGIPSVQRQGRRVTDEATLDAAKMAFSAINRDLVAALLASGSQAIGFASFDAGLVHSRRRAPLPISTLTETGERRTELIDFGLVAEIDRVDPSILSSLWECQQIPVVSCLASTAEGQILNINADTLATHLAVGLRAPRLISVTDVEGIYFNLDDPSSRLDELTANQARVYLEEGRFTEGMIPKIQAGLRAIEMGVPEVQVLSGLRPDGLLQGIEDKAGTRIIP